ncbi:MAG: hypothetical protein IT366_21500 [Candidatus Hydrogenedentes bacterium]|nr:hypothetical protein [Candidatus Hydrogenedentota bacterium]
MTFEMKDVITILVQVGVFAFGYGTLWTKVNALARIVSNGLSEKVTRMDKTLAVIADREGIEVSE